MARGPSHVALQDLQDFIEIKRQDGANLSISRWVGRLKELATTYGDSNPQLSGLQAMLASSEYQAELENQMQTFGSDAARAEDERFLDQARTVSTHVRREAKTRDSLPIDGFTATFLALDQGTHRCEDIERALASRVADHFAKNARETVAESFGKGHPWRGIRTAIENQDGRLRPFVVATAVRSTLLESEQEVIRRLVAAEERLGNRLDRAVLSTSEDGCDLFVDLLDDIRVAGFDADDSSLLANRIAQGLRDGYMATEEERVRETTSEWSRRLMAVMARSQRDTWANSLAKRRESLTQEAANHGRVLEAVDRLHRALSATKDIQLPASLARLSVFAGVDEKTFRNRWAAVGTTLSDVRARVEALQANVRERLSALPRTPLAADAAQEAWQRWVVDATAALTRYMTAANLPDPAAWATGCLDATRRELVTWQIRQRTTPEVVRQIDACQPWEQIAATASRTGDGALAHALERAFTTLRNARTWQDLAPVARDLDSTRMSVALFAVSKSPDDVQRLGALLLDNILREDAPREWWVLWVDGFGDMATSWAALLRYLATSAATLRRPNDPMESLLTIVPDGGRSQTLLEAHRAIEGIDGGAFDASAFGSAASAIRHLLDTIALLKERALVRLEARCALYAALALVPLSSDHGGRGLRPLWTRHDTTAQAAHLEPAWLAVVEASDDLYWKTRRLAPFNRRITQKRETALLGLTESMHFSPGHLERLRETNGEGPNAIPTAAEILGVGLALTQALGQAVSDKAVVGWGRDSLESQLRHIGLSLLALDFEPVSEYAKARVPWIARCVAGGLGPAATSVALLEQLRRTLDDAAWVLRHSAVAERTGAQAATQIRDQLDLSRAAAAGGDVALLRIIDRILALRANDAAEATFEDEAATEVLVEALSLVGTTAPRAAEREKQVLWNHARVSLQEYSRHFVRSLLPDLRASVLRRLRGLVLDSPDGDVARTRLSHLAFLDPSDTATATLQQHLAASYG